MTKPAFHIRQLPPTTSAETIERAGTVLATAFDGTPLTILFSGSDAELAQARMVELVTTTVLDLEAYVAETDAGEIIGVMLVKPKGTEHRKR